LKLAQETVEMVQHSVYAFEGTLCRFIVDDKGAAFLIAFGLPPFKHENDSLRAVEAGLMIHARLPHMLAGRGLQDVVCSIGVNSGRVFCGSVGGRLRCEYTLHGTSVNMAARFMQHAKGTILCGADTFKDCESAIDFAPPKLIKVSKGSLSIHASIVIWPFLCY
jgi:class 3 adenylate cyclase